MKLLPRYRRPAQTSRQRKSAPTYYDRFLWIANSLIIGFLLLWLIVSNSLVNRLAGDPSIRQAQTNVERHLAKKTNQSALRLMQLSQGISGTPYDELLSVAPQQDGLAYGTSLFEYLQAELLNQGQQPTPLLLKWQQYITSQSGKVGNIRNHLLTQEAPWFDEKTLLHSSYGGISIRKLLLADALLQSRRNQPRIALEDLEASWKLNSVFHHYPNLSVQEGAQSIHQLQSVTLRLIENLPVGWQKRLPDPDYSQTLPLAFQGEIDRISFYALKYYFSDRDSRSSQSLAAALWSKFSDPYYFFIDRDFWRNLVAVHTEALKHKPLCQFDDEYLRQVWHPSFWNPRRAYRSRSFQVNPPLNAETTSVDFPQQYQWVWTSARKAAIDWELTKKILQVKELAAQTGRFPAVVAGIDSSAVCPEIRWGYQASADRQAMSIALQEADKWVTIGKHYLPVTYRTRLPKTAQ